MRRLRQKDLLQHLIPSFQTRHTPMIRTVISLQRQMLSQMLPLLLHFVMMQITDSYMRRAKKAIQLNILRKMDIMGLDREF